MANWLFIWLEPRNDSDVIGKADCPTVPGMDSAIGVLLGEMDCEENAFTGIDCEAVTFRDGLDVPCIYIVPVGV